MISSRASDGSVSVVPEEPDDLISLRRVIRVGDTITASTTRAIRAEREHARPDRGERRRISVRLTVEMISLDSVLDRLRISGTISESSHESVSHGSHHSVVVTPGERIAISKRNWSALDRRLLRPERADCAYVLVAVDSRECGVARLAGTHLKIIGGIRSGAGGKRYNVTSDPRAYHADIRAAVSACAQAGDGLVVFGPGLEKGRVCAKLAGLEGVAEPQVAEGIDSGGEDGIHLFAKSETMRRIMSESKLARVLNIVDEVIRLAGQQSARFAMGYRDVLRAVDAGAAASIVFSDRLLADVGEDPAVGLLNSAEAGGTEIYAVDTSTDIGMRVSGLGGVIAILRFALR